MLQVVCITDCFGANVIQADVSAADVSALLKLIMLNCPQIISGYDIFFDCVGFGTKGLITYIVVWRNLITILSWSSGASDQKVVRIAAKIASVDN
jgi:hypothetical protein